jgi:6-phosphogluconolactonase/glucosamine-6-phosphate isomerase/deaminase
MSVTIRINDKAEAENTLCDALIEATRFGKKVLFLLPGGSSAGIGANVWGKLPVESQALITISLTDERFGPVGHPDSNWLLLQKLGLDLSDERHIPVLQNLETKDETATAWAEKLGQTTDVADSVVALFGIGTDHHIAGIKPKSPAVYETEALTSAYQGEDFERVTITPVVFNKITHGFIYAEGPVKAEAIKSLDNEQDYTQSPDELIKRCTSFMIYYKA